MTKAKEALELMPEYHPDWDPEFGEDEILREWFAKSEKVLRRALLILDKIECGYLTKQYMKAGYHAANSNTI